MKLIIEEEPAVFYISYWTKKRWARKLPDFMLLLLPSQWIWKHHQKAVDGTMRPFLHDSGLHHKIRFEQPEDAIDPKVEEVITPDGRVLELGEAIELGGQPIEDHPPG